MTELYPIPFTISYKKILVSETVIKNTFFLDSRQLFIKILESQILIEEIILNKKYQGSF